MQKFRNKKYIKYLIITMMVIVSFLFFLLNMFFSTNGFTSNITKENLIYTAIPAISIVFAMFAIGFSSSTIQFISKNPLASPMTIGIFPALTFSYLITYIFGVSSNIWIRALLNIVLSFAIISVYLIIDLKVDNKSKIIFSFVLSVALSSLSAIIYIKYGLQRSGTLLFSLDELDFTKEKMFIGIALVLIGFVSTLLLKKKIHIFSTSESRATTLGVKIKSMKAIVMYSSATMLAGAFIMFGILAFVGLIIPNITKLLGFNKYWISSIVSGVLSILLGVVAFFFSKLFFIDLFLIYSIIVLPLIIIVFFRIRKVVSIE